MCKNIILFKMLIFKGAAVWSFYIYKELCIGNYLYSLFNGGYPVYVCVKIKWSELYNILQYERNLFCIFHNFYTLYGLPMFLVLQFIMCLYVFLYIRGKKYIYNLLHAIVCIFLHSCFPFRIRLYIFVPTSYL